MCSVLLELEHPPHGSSYGRLGHDDDDDHVSESSFSPVVLRMMTPYDCYIRVRGLLTSHQAKSFRHYL